MAYLPVAAQPPGLVYHVVSPRLLRPGPNGRVLDHQDTARPWANLWAGPLGVRLVYLRLARLNSWGAPRLLGRKQIGRRLLIAAASHGHVPVSKRRAVSHQTTNQSTASSPTTTSSFREVRNFCFLRHPGQLKAFFFITGESLDGQKSKTSGVDSGRCTHLENRRQKEDTSTKHCSISKANRGRYSTKSIQPGAFPRFSRLMQALLRAQELSPAEVRGFHFQRSMAEANKFPPFADALEDGRRGYG
jgi:hypothetical protein